MHNTGLFYLNVAIPMTYSCDPCSTSSDVANPMGSGLWNQWQHSFQRTESRLAPEMGRWCRAGILRNSGFCRSLPIMQWNPVEFFGDASDAREAVAAGHARAQEACWCVATHQLYVHGHERSIEVIGFLKEFVQRKA